MVDRHKEVEGSGSVSKGHRLHRGGNNLMRVCVHHLVGRNGS